MPFDATPELPVETRLLDEMLRIFGPSGENWIQQEEADKVGGFCMIGALSQARVRLRIFGDDTEAKIMQAICRHNGQPFAAIDVYNDDGKRTFSDVREVLELAKT